MAEEMTGFTFLDVYYQSIQNECTFDWITKIGVPGQMYDLNKGGGSRRFFGQRKI